MTVNKKPRDLNIEVLCCFLMLCIIIYHGCNNGPFLVDGMYHDVKFGAWVLYWPTNAFVFISGWYGINFTWSRFAKFIWMIVYASLVALIFSPLAFNQWRFSISPGWFGTSYLALMLLAPLINAGMKALEKESETALIGAWLTYSVAMLLSWAPIKFLNIDFGVPGWFGHSFNTILYIYISAFVLKRSIWFSSIRFKFAIVLFLFALLGHVLLTGLTVVSPVSRLILSEAGDYNSPFVLIGGAMIFLIFKRLHFSSAIERMCSYLAPSMFVVYLLHTHPTGAFIRNHFILSIDHLLMNIPGHRIIAVITSGVVVMVVCCLLDQGRRYVIPLLFHRK